MARKGGRPRSAAVTERYVKLYKLSMEGKKRGEIAREMDMTMAEVARDLDRARAMFAIEPTQEVITEHQRLLWEGALTLRDRYLDTGDLWTYDRYLKTLEALERVGGVAFADRKAAEKDDKGSEVDKWVAGSVEDGGKFASGAEARAWSEAQTAKELADIEAQIIDEYDDDDLADLTPDEQLDQDEQHLTAQPVKKRREAAR